MRSWVPGSNRTHHRWLWKLNNSVEVSRFMSETRTHWSSERHQSSRVRSAPFRGATQDLSESSSIVEPTWSAQHQQARDAQVPQDQLRAIHHRGWHTRQGQLRRVSPRNDWTSRLAYEKTTEIQPRSRSMAAPPLTRTNSFGAIAKLSFRVPAAAHTSSYCNKSGSTNTRS